MSSLKPTDALPRIAWVQLGCPKNQVDGEWMLARLAAAGYPLVGDPQAADLLVINTCAFIADAQRESIDEILAAAAWKEARPGRRLIVAGCLAERHGTQLLRELPEVDACLGPGRLSEIEALVARVVAGARGLCRCGGLGGVPATGPRLRSGAPHTSYLKIAEGCNQRCSFCLIPRLRGAQVSRDVAGLVAEAEQLGEEGVVELVLVAQDTTSYGTDLEPQVDLVGLLQALLQRPGPEWIRLLYTHPAHWSEELIDLFATHPRLLSYVDLPFQHSEDPVLAAMGRGHDGRRLRDLIESLRQRIPDLVLRGTALVGHPGEDRHAHRALLQFLKEFPFDRLGAFAYSREPETRAARRRDAPEPALATERLNEVLALQREVALQQQRRRIGRQLTVLTEALDTRARRILARSYGEAPEIDGWIRIAAATEDELEGVALGEFHAARITGAGPYDLEADLVTGELSQ